MIFVAATVGVLYAWGVRSLARRRRAWPVLRSMAAAAAALTLAASELVPQDTLTDHMVEHILLGMVAPLLFALSAPITLALQTAPAPWRQLMRTGLHSPVARWLAHPVVGLVFFGVSLIVLYLTPLLELSARNVVVHVAVHVHLMAAGAVFMWPLVGLDPIPRRTPFGARVLTVMAAVPFHAFLGVAVMSTTTALAPAAYPSLDDQHRAGGLLWLSGEIMTFVLLFIVVRAWSVADSRISRRADAIHTPTARTVKPSSCSSRTWGWRRLSGNVMSSVSFGILAVQIEDRSTDGTRVIHLRGELDLSNCEVALSACTAEGARDVVIDLGELAFMSCSGYGALVSARRVLEARDGSLTIRSEAGQPRRLLALVEASISHGA